MPSTIVSPRLLASIFLVTATLGWTACAVAVEGSLAETTRADAAAPSAESEASRGKGEPTAPPEPRDARDGVESEPEREPKQDAPTKRTKTSTRARANEASSCESTRAELESLLPQVQSCTTDAQCGQVIKGSSCGCTLDLVARLDADLSAFDEAREQGCGLGRVTVCSCPAAEGFRCDAGRCSWNYL